MSVRVSSPIKKGDLVTITLDEYQTASNTYLVAVKLDNDSLLSHPLAPEIYIMRPDTELNQTMATLQNQVEKALFYAKKNSESLGYTMAGDLSALCFYFVIRKEFTPKQRHDLANVCGKIASIKLNNNISAAVTMIKQNRALLDEYNYSLLNGIKSVIDDPLSLKTKHERYTIFNIAGFILAQSSIQ